MPSVNKVILACAGSGKTTLIVDQALKMQDKRVLITTYTNENLSQIRRYFIEKVGCVPPNIVVQSWFTFLLRDGVRPYQNCKVDCGRAQSVYFFKNKSDIALRKSLRYKSEDQNEYYFSKSNFLYEDKASQFICKCDDRTNGKIIGRLEKIYDCMLIDEAQDLEGWDYELIGKLFDSSMAIILVGDPRQKILKTHRHNKNKKHVTIFEWLPDKKENQYTLDERTESWRCNQSICDFSDDLYPELPKSSSKNESTSEHDGMFFVSSSNIDEYLRNYAPVILRYRKTKKTSLYDAINIGLAKGRTYDRVLIIPTKPMIDYLVTRDLATVGDKAKLYVAVTRARSSVAFLVDNKDLSDFVTKWTANVDSNQ